MLSRSWKEVRPPAELITRRLKEQRQGPPADSGRKAGQAAPTPRDPPRRVLGSLPARLEACLEPTVVLEGALPPEADALGNLVANDGKVGELGDLEDGLARLRMLRPHCGGGETGECRE